MGPPQACGRRPSSEGVVFHLLPFCHLSDRYSALWKLLEQRELLLFVHEYTRRLRLMTAYTSRVQRLLEPQTQELNLTPNQNSPDSAPSWVGLCSLSQELRIHLSHWACLSSRIQSSDCLRRAMARHSRMLQAVKESLDLLGLQALLVIERYIHALLCTVARTGSDSLSVEVLEDVLRGMELYNLAVEEHSMHHSALLQWTVVLQQAHYSSSFSSPPQKKRSWPSPVPVEQLLTIMAAHHADRAAEQLHQWISQKNCPVQEVLSKRCTNLGPEICRGFDVQTYRWTWKQLQNLFVINPSTPIRKPRSESLHDGYVERSVVENPGSVWPKGTSFQRGGESTFQSGSGLTRMDSDIHLEHPSAQLLCQVLLSSSDLLPPPVPCGSPVGEPMERVLAALSESNCRSEGETAAAPKDKSSEDLQRRRGQNHVVDEIGSDRTEQDPTNRDERGENVESRRARRCGSRWPHSVQWLDLSGPLLLTDLLGRYRSLLWFFCRRVLWLKLHVPGDAPEGSLNLYDDLTTFMVLERISKAVDTGLLPDEYQAMLEELGLHVKVLCSHAHWDQGVCRTLCSSLRDKCVVPHESGVPPSVDRRNLSQTMESFLQLPPSLLWSLHSPQSGLQVSGAANLNPHMSDLQSRTVSMVLASVQLSTVWVVSKAFQFLSSWSLHKFLLITQGDLEMLMESVEEMMRQLLRLDVNRQPSICSLQLGQQLVALKEAASELQVFSSLVLKTFSVACKQMSEEIFEQNMPSAGHWRSSKLTGFPSNPSTYAALAAQTVIGQVLEGVAQLPDEARVRALSVTMTAFMEAWMEHILKERIKFSVQGALQLKRDFDSVRLMVQSECYGLSAELLQKLLSLRVFQQVDSVVLCLLQQPQDRSSLKSSTWEPLIRCCPTSSRDSMDAAAAGHITNLGFLDGEEPNQSDAPVLNSDLLAVDPPTPAEPYLAPSTVLGPAQQDWLDLRIQSGARRWRLPGLQCLSKAEL
ncbi:uncharacterized protein ccdc142 isoform X2 [Oryzias latipes]